MPLKLSDLGEELDKKLKLKSLIKSLVEEYNLRDVVINDDLVPYDIQEFAKKWIYENTDKFMISYKEIHFKAIAFEKGIQLEAIYDAMAIVLRDELLYGDSKNKE